MILELLILLYFITVLGFGLGMTWAFGRKGDTQQAFFWIWFAMVPIFASVLPFLPIVFLIFGFRKTIEILQHYKPKEKRKRK